MRPISMVNKVIYPNLLASGGASRGAASPAGVALLGLAQRADSPRSPRFGFAEYLSKMIDKRTPQSRYRIEVLTDSISNTTVILEVYPVCLPYFVFSRTQTPHAPIWLPLGYPQNSSATRMMLEEATQSKI